MCSINSNSKAELDQPFDLASDYAHGEVPWDIIGSYFKNDHLSKLVRHHLESYNYFTECQIAKTIDMFNPILVSGEQKRYLPIVPQDGYIYNEDGTVDVADTTEDGEDYLRRVEQPFVMTIIDVSINIDNFRISQPQIHENSGAIKVMFPNEARQRNFTYAAAMTVDVALEYTVKSPDGEIQHFSTRLDQIHIGKLPIMVKSNICVLSQYSHVGVDQTEECAFDPGGYFIVKGSEKIVLGQKRMAENNIMCGLVSNSNLKNYNKYKWVAEIRCIPPNKCISPKQVNLYYSRNATEFGNAIYVALPKIKVVIPLFIVFRAFGIISDRDICALIMGNIDIDDDPVMLDSLAASATEANEHMTQDTCVQYIANYAMFTTTHIDKTTSDKTVGARMKREFTRNVIHNDVFVHCTTLTQKQHFLGYMVNRLLTCVHGRVPADDRDSYKNTRIDTTGVLLNTLFRTHYNKVVKDLETQLVREISYGSWKSTNDYKNIVSMTNIYKLVKPATIENNIIRALSTGDFGVKYNNTSKVGVAQVLNRLAYVSSISHARRISTPNKNGKLTEPRKLHGTSWGLMCPAETPEGASVGIVQNMSYLAHITVQSGSDFIYNYLMSVTDPLAEYEGLSATEWVDRKHDSDLVKVFFNGCWLGSSSSPRELYLDLKDKKYKGIITVYTSIVFKYSRKEIWVNNQPGRLMRPLLKVVDNNILVSSGIVARLRRGDLEWNDLLIGLKIKRSVIEYIDSDEHDSSTVATFPRDILSPTKNVGYYTHCEIHPNTLFGILASCIPFSDNNQSPRNTYQCAQSKQTIGIYATNFASRMDKTSHILNYPAKPLVDTRTTNIIKLDCLPAGTTVIVAIMTHTGYNQEDSILFNKGSIDRGMFSATIYHTEKDEDTQNVNGGEEIRCKPDPTKTKGMKLGNYNKIGKNGVVPENTLIEFRDIIISKIKPIKKNRNDPTKTIKFEDQSKIFKTKEESYVDKNLINHNGDGYNLVKVRSRAMRKPVIGDKFSSRHGQKGTVGNIIPEKDMPFTAEGLRPDIIINPHAIPSRMTIGQLKETILGKVLLELGMFGDGTAFGSVDLAFICSELSKLGYCDNGNELMHDGLTGEQLECSVFIGPVFYQRLKHMVSDKVHSRATGPMVYLTRQPVEGKTRDGGFKIGEMERDCMISHGMSRFAKDRLYDSSDKYSVHVCNKCGSIAAYNEQFHISHCKICDNRVSFSRADIPYSCKLMFQELNAMNVAPRLIMES